jgi:hypothetical protein
LSSRDAGHYRSLQTRATSRASTNAGTPPGTIAGFLLFANLTARGVSAFLAELAIGW